MALRNYLPSANVSQEVQKFLESRNMPIGPNVQEVKIINRVMLERERGTDATGTSFEEKAIPKGGTVTYSKEKIVVKDKKGEETVIPNAPLPPAVPGLREGQGRLVAVLTAFYDLDQGEITTIRSTTFEKQFFPDGSIYNPDGVYAVKSMLSALMVKSTVKGDTFTMSGTCRGHMATDFWYRFTSALSQDDYMALYYTVITDLLNTLVQIPPKKGSKLVTLG